MNFRLLGARLQARGRVRGELLQHRLDALRAGLRRALVVKEERGAQVACGRAAPVEREDEEEFQDETHLQALQRGKLCDAVSAQHVVSGEGFLQVCCFAQLRFAAVENFVEQDERERGAVERL